MAVPPSLPQAPSPFGTYLNQYSGPQQQGPGDYNAWVESRGGIKNYIDPSVTGAYQNKINARYAPIDYSNPAYQYGQQQAQRNAFNAASRAGVRGPFSVGAANQAQYQYGLNYAGQQQARQNQEADAAVTGLANYMQQARGLNDQASDAMKKAYNDEVARVQTANADAGRYGFETASKLYKTDLDNYRTSLKQYYMSQAPAGVVIENIMSPGALDRWADQQAAMAMPPTDFSMYAPNTGPAYVNAGLANGGRYNAGNAGF